MQNLREDEWIWFCSFAENEKEGNSIRSCSSHHYHVSWWRWNGQRASTDSTTVYVAWVYTCIYVYTVLHCSLLLDADEKITDLQCREFWILNYVYVLRMYKPFTDGRRQTTMKWSARRRTVDGGGWGSVSVSTTEDHPRHSPLCFMDVACLTKTWIGCICYFFVFYSISNAGSTILGTVAIWSPDSPRK